MTTIPLYGGPLKRELVKRAYGLCGQSVTEFELTPEEYDLALQAMNDLAGTMPDFPFNYPDFGIGSAQDESGIAATDVMGFIAMLASEIAPNIGKTYSPNGVQAGAMSALRARYQAVPLRQLGRDTPRGIGGRRRFGPYFTADVSDSETIQ